MKTKKCEMCNGEFWAYRKTAKFCSRKCYLDSRWGTAICPICKKSNKSNFRYCSSKCRKQANKESSWRGRHKKEQQYKKQKSKLFEYLGNKCQLCGFNNSLALEIHHPKGQESGWKRNQGRWVRYWKERDTIQLVCANCHRIIHCGNSRKD